jgi:hypothetical protein
MGRLGTYALSLCLLLITVIPQQSAAAQSDEKAITYQIQNTIDGSTNVKFPRIAGLSNQVVAVGNPGGSNPSRNGVAWQKQDSAETFPSGFTLGEADGQADYSTAAVHGSRFDNAFYATWIDQDRNRIYVRRKPLGGEWESTKISASSNFPNFPDVVHTSDGKIFTIYRDNSRWNYSVSSDGGNNWSGGQVSRISPITQADIEAGPNGRVVVVHEDTNTGDILLSTWNGSGFDTERIAGDGGGGRYYTTPTVAIGNDGRIYVAWRSEDGEVYYAERQSDGSWPASRIARGGRVEYGVSIHVDNANNLYLNWISNESGAPRVYFTFRPSGGNWEPIIRSPSPGALFNGDAAVTISDNGYAHYVAEYFSGVGLRTRYFRFQADVRNCEAIVAFTGGATQTNSRTITGAVGAAAGCTNDQRQISLNTRNEAAPRTTNNPNTFSIEVPADQIGQCTQTVYARLFNGNTAYDWGSNTIKVDPADAPNPVNANVTLRNPYLDPARSAASPSSSPKDTLNDDGAWFGDPRFTRVKQAVLNVSDAGDCTGLATFSGLDQSNTAVPAGGFRQTVALPLGNGGTPPLSFDPGPKSFPVTVADNVGNTQIFNVSVVYDPADVAADGDGLGRPVVQDEGEVSADNSAAARLTTIRTLTFNAVKVSDNLYNAGNDVNVPTNGQFWGVWIATEYLGTTAAPTQPVGPDSTTLNYYPLEVTNRACDSLGCDFSVSVNLFQGLGFGPDLTKAGTYRVYARFLDGAGNYSTAVVDEDFTLDEGYRPPSVFLSIVGR